MNILRNLYYRLSPGLRFLARKIVYTPVDLYETVTGKRDTSIPPRSMIFTGSGDFRQQGEKLLYYFEEYGGLKKHHDFLDIGCGIGRIAIPLTTFLDRSAAYEGFDAIQKGVDWCRKNISREFPNFHFQHIPLQNDLYRKGGEDPARFRFPYESGQFDFIAVISVFTHMLPEELVNYLEEINRVLKPGGTCFATFFIWRTVLSGESKGNTGFQFPHDYGHYRLMDKRVKRANVAFDEDYLLDKIRACGMTVRHRFPGHWSSGHHKEAKDFQDILIFNRNKA